MHASEPAHEVLEGKRFPVAAGRHDFGVEDERVPLQSAARDLDDATRTGRVRIELPNPGLELKPDMYADVRLEKRLGERLAVPESAVLYAGDRRFVFVDLGDGRLAPRPVEVGLSAGDDLEITAGLAAGERVVTSGNFLVAAESRLKLALEHWGHEDGAPKAPPPPAGHAGH